jgi:hypothetical protein
MGRMFAIIGGHRCADIPTLLMKMSETVTEELGSVHGMAYWHIKEFAFRRMPSESRRRLALTAIAPPPVMMAHSRKSLPVEGLLPFGTQPFPCRGGALMHQGVVTLPARWPDEQADSQVLCKFVEESGFPKALERLDNPFSTIFASDEATVHAAAFELPLYVREHAPGVHIIHDFADSIGGDDIRDSGIVTFTA